MVKGHHLQLRCYPPLFHNYEWLNIKDHHPLIQKKIDELLAKGSIKAYAGGAGIYSLILFVVSKHTDGFTSHIKC